MKKLSYFIVGMAMLTSCSDLFDPAIENNLGVDYMYQNPQYAEGVLANAYTYLVCDGYSMNEMATDDAVCNQASNGYRNMAAGTWTSSNNPMNVWETCYNKIMYLNIFLNRCDNVAWADDPVACKMYNDREAGEAYGLRAMNMFYLLQSHSGYGDDGVLYGVPIILDEMDATSDYNLPRATFEECVNQIYSDCEKALALLPEKYGDIADESEIPAKYAELNPTASQYNRVFGSKFTGRMVGSIVRAYMVKTALLAASPAYNANGNTELWTKVANASGEMLSKIGGIAGMDINLNPSNPSRQYHYNAYIRYTEMFLDYAEAANEAWGPTATGSYGFSAYDVIKALHNRCGAGNDYLESIKNDKDKMRQLIRNERRIELSFEGHRFWDLRRWNVSLDQLNATARGMSISQADGTYTPIDVDPRLYKDYQIYGPIPYGECLKYGNLKQNRGW